MIRLLHFKKIIQVLNPILPCHHLSLEETEQQSLKYHIFINNHTSQNVQNSNNIYQYVFYSWKTSECFNNYFTFIQIF